MEKQKHESKNSTFFWTMEFHIEFIESIIYCLHSVIAHHPGQHEHVRSAIKKVITNNLSMLKCNCNHETELMIQGQLGQTKEHINKKFTQRCHSQQLTTS